MFGRFNERFKQTFDVAPLALLPDTFPKPRRQGVTPRLGVVLERTSDLRRFFDDEGFNFNRSKQDQVVRIFNETVPTRGLSRRFGLSFTQRRVDWTQSLFVYFTDFESIAKWAAHDEMKQPALDAFVSRLELNGDFWCTVRFAGPPVVFVYTDEQAQHLRTDEVRNRWADLYFALVHEHDEFGYVSRDEIVIEVDSKETFDRDYDGNWYYYFK